MDRKDYPMRYFQPKSITWWGGISLMAIGIAMMVFPSSNLGEVSTVLAVLNGGGDASPAGSFLLGMSIVGLRDKMERG